MTSSARFTWRAFALAALAGVAVLLFSGTASAEPCETGCEDASDRRAPELLGSPLKTVNGLVQQPVDRLLGTGEGAAGTTSPDTAEAAPATEAASAAASESTPEPTQPVAPEPAQPVAPEPAQQATNAVSTATTLATATPSLDVAEPVVSTVTDTVETVVPAADTVTSEARDLLKGQPLQDAVDTTADAITEIGTAAVPAVAGTMQTLDATTQQLLDTAHATTTVVLDSAQRAVATATSTLQPVTDSVTSALAITLGVAAPAGSAPSAIQAESGSGAKQLGGATLGDSPPTSGVAMPGSLTELVTHPASADSQVPTPPPDQTSDEASAADGDESAIVLTGQHAAPAPAAPGASAANGGGTTSPSTSELGNACFDLSPAAPQPGFVPALHHSAHVPAAPVVEPAQSPD